MTAYAAKKHGVSWNVNLKTTKTVKEKLRSHEGRDKNTTSLLPLMWLDPQWRVSMLKKRCLSWHMRDTKGFRAAICLRNIWKKRSCNSQHMNRFVAFTDARWKKYRDNRTKTFLKGKMQIIGILWNLRLASTSKRGRWAPGSHWPPLDQNRGNMRDFQSSEVRIVNLKRVSLSWLASCAKIVFQVLPAISDFGSGRIRDFTAR